MKNSIILVSLLLLSGCMSMTDERCDPSHYTMHDYYDDERVTFPKRHKTNDYGIKICNKCYAKYYASDGR